MALSRDSRMDRRRRVLLDASSAQQSDPVSNRRSNPPTSGETGVKKSAGYSQDVRQACGTRLVQLIPVRRRSFMALIGTSLTITTCLLVVHYLVYVTGYLPWYGHPLVIALDLTHPQSIASWLGSHLWLLCLGATILTFQLRRHKLDDYNGEYRLWFWLVFTCVLASIDSTTHISELFALGLDKWAQLNLGWSGKALVTATMSTLVGMLGLRLCSELKTVPFSLVCWLVGLAAWAGSTALAQEQFLSTMAIQTRVWLRASLWLGGLTSIWISAVAYLRFVYMDAQRRFLARGLLARRATAIPLRERMRQSIPFGRRRNDNTTDESDAADSEAARWSLRRVFGRRAKPATEAAPATTRRSKSAQPVASSQPAAAVQSTLSQDPAPPLRSQTSAAPLGSVNRSQLPAGSSSSSNRSQPTENSNPAPAASSASASKQARDSELVAKNKLRWPFGFKLWPGKDIPEEEALEYRKIRDEERERREFERKQQREAAAAEKAAAKQARLKDREAAKQAKLDAKRQSKSEDKRESQGEPKSKKQKSANGVGKKMLAPVVALGGVFKKIKLPSLSAFKLNPPEEGSGNSTSTASGNSNLKPVAQGNQPLPNTSRPAASPIPGTNQIGTNQLRGNSASYQDDDEDADDDRQMSKADRKKLRRQNRAA